MQLPYSNKRAPIVALEHNFQSELSFLSRCRGPIQISPSSIGSSILEISFDKAYEMIATDEIKDAKTIMLLQYMKINQIL